MKKKRRSLAASLLVTNSEETCSEMMKDLTLLKVMKIMMIMKVIMAMTVEQIRFR